MQLNTHIQECLDKATYEILGVKQVDQKEFAEMIVRQCAELANEETSLPYKSYSEKIKKHFGVNG